MVICPECEGDLDIEEDEVDEGEIVSCPECGTDFEVVAIEPFELTRVEDEEERKTRKRTKRKRCDDQAATGHRQRLGFDLWRQRPAIGSLAGVGGCWTPLLGRKSSKSAEQAAKRDYALIYGTVWGSGRSSGTLAFPSISAGSPIGRPSGSSFPTGNGEFALSKSPRRDPGLDIVQANIKTPKGQPKPEATVHIENNERKDVGIHLSK